MMEQEVIKYVVQRTDYPHKFFTGMMHSYRHPNKPMWAELTKAKLYTRRGDAAGNIKRWKFTAKVTEVLVKLQLGGY